MFTGIVTEIGTVKKILKKGKHRELFVSCKDTLKAVKTGDSVAVNGVCLTVTKIFNGLTFDAVSNTIKKTNLSRLKIGDKVNLENALRQGDPIGGHMVSGHIDGERKIKKSQRTHEGWILDVSFTAEDGQHLIPRGSVAIDGVSLTVAEVHKGFFRIFIVPHTLDSTIIKQKKTGDYVNVEFDMMGKYAGRNKTGNITKDLLSEKGFM